MNTNEIRLVVTEEYLEDIEENLYNLISAKLQTYNISCEEYKKKRKNVKVILVHEAYFKSVYLSKKKFNFW